MLKPLLQDLEQSQVFLNWKKDYSKSFLSHFFVQINSELKEKTGWDVGYYNPEDEKVTVFCKDSDDNFLQKPSDDVFKKEESVVEELEMEDVKINLEDAKVGLKKLVPEKFPAYTGLLGDGFMILQKLGGQTSWSLTLMTKKLTMINVKISAENGDFLSKDEINFLNQQPGKAA
jgi:hypothetical protein